MTPFLARSHRPFRKLYLLSLGVSFIALTTGNPAHAECSPAATSGNDIILCTSGAPDPSTPPAQLGDGDDSIDFSSGTFNGGVNGGSGADSFSVSGGTINGTLNGGADNDRFTVSGGTVASILDTSGNNSLTMSTGGSGTITGNVSFGDGRDTITMAGGEIQGTVSQGNGIDTLILTGGTINEVFQGGDLDQATISGGRIVNGLSDGDFVTITGGRIGFVDMNIANNSVTMSGGQIDGDLTASFQNDTLIMSGGTIGGRVDYGRGANVITMSGGTVVGTITTGDGVDRYTMSGGSTAGINAGAGDDVIAISGTASIGAVNGEAGADSISIAGGTVTSVLGGDGNDLITISGGTVGAIDAGDGDDSFSWNGGTLASFNGGIGSDTAVVTGGADFSRTTLLDGGDDASTADGWIDTLRFQSVNTALPTLANWEQVSVEQNSHIPIPAGGIEFGNGNVTVDGTSSLTGGPDAGGEIHVGGNLGNAGAITSEAPVDVVVDGNLDNSGLIDPGGGEVAVGGTLTNTGSIIGGGAVIEAPQGIVNNGTIDLSGGGTADTLTIVGNVTGSGQIIVDTDIADGTADSVTIQGTLGGAVDTIVHNEGGPVTDPPQPGSGVTLITATQGVTANLSLNGPYQYEPIGPWRYELVEAGGAVQFAPHFDVEDGASLAAYAPSAAGAAVAPDAVLGMTEQLLPHIRERQGQGLRVAGDLHGWVRVEGQKSHVGGEGYRVGYDQRSGFVQVGLGFTRPAGSGAIMTGLTFGLARGDWDARLRSARADLDLDGHAFGFYATWLQDPEQKHGWYADFVAQYASFDLDLDVPQGPIADYHGSGTAASLEVGNMIPAGRLRIEPTARVSWLGGDINGFTGDDGLIAQANDNNRVRGRASLRLSTDVPMGASLLTPSLRLGVRHDFKADRGVGVGFTTIETNTPRTAAEGSLGLTLKLAPAAALFTEVEGAVAQKYWRATLRGGVSIRW